MARIDIMFGMFGDKDTDRDVSDFQNVPATDKGNSDYTDQGKLGTYAPTDKPYPAPKGVKFYAGYGATEEDLQRGYKEAPMREAPNYDLDNYKRRSTEPKKTDEDFNNSGVLDKDWEFRNRNRMSRGILTRPTNSRER